MLELPLARKGFQGLLVVLVYQPVGFDFVRELGDSEHASAGADEGCHGNHAAQNIPCLSNGQPGTEDITLENAYWYVRILGPTVVIMNMNWVCQVPYLNLLLVCS